MTIAGWSQILILLAVLTALTPLLGGYMSRVYSSGGRVLLNFLAALFLGPFAQSLTRHLF